MIFIRSAFQLPCFCLALFFCGGTLQSGPLATAWNVDSTFDPLAAELDGRVLAIAVDESFSDSRDPSGDAGRVVVGGSFTRAGGISSRGIARFLADGSLDMGFDPGQGIDGTVYDLVVLEDGSIIAVGSFTSYYASWSATGNIVKIRADGSIDNSFESGWEKGTDGEINDIELLPDGKVLIGGTFTSYSGVPRESLARLNADGTLDPAFDADFARRSNMVWQTKVLPDGRVLAAGSFYLDAQSTTTISLVRLLSDSSIDTAFAAPEAPDYPSTLWIRDDAQILVGNQGGSWGDPLVRLFPNGDLDRWFFTEIRGEMFALHEVADGRLIVGGAISAHSGEQNYDNLAVLDEDGALNVDTFPEGISLDGTVSRIAADSHGRLYIGGDFASINGFSCSGLVRVDTGPAASFGEPQVSVTEGQSVQFSVRLNMEAEDPVSVYLEVESDSQDLLNEVQLQSARLDFYPGSQEEIGYLQAAANSRIDGPRELRIRIAEVSGPIAVSASAVLPVSVLDDNEPGTVFFESSSYLLREELEAVEVRVRRWENDPGQLSVRCQSVDGSAVGDVDYVRVDDVIHFPEGVYEQTITLQALASDNIAPPFRDFTLELTALDGSVTIGDPGSARITVNDKDNPGSIDPTFRAGDVSGATSLVSLSLNRSGELYAIARTTDSFDIMKYRADGEASVFASIPASAALGGLRDLKTAIDGSVYAGGNELFRFNPDGRPHTDWIDPHTTWQAVQTMEVLPDGRLVVGGITHGSRRSVARLFADGSKDSSFDPGSLTFADGVPITCIRLDPEGKLMIAGRLLSIQGHPRKGVARLYRDGPLDLSFDASAALDALGKTAAAHMEVLPDGRLYLVAAAPSGSGEQVLVRVSDHGLLDEAFAPVLIEGGYLTDLAVQPDGKLVLTLTHDAMVNGEPATVARFHADGTRDREFAVYSPDDDAEACLVGPDGRIYVSGRFTDFDGLRVPMIAAVKGGEGSAGGLIQWKRGNVQADPASGTIELALERSVGTDGRVGAYFLAVGKTAQPGVDYVHTAGFILFEPGQTTRTIPVDLLGEKVVEEPRVFELILHHSSGGALVGERFRTQVELFSGDLGSLESWIAHFFPESAGDSSILLVDSNGNGSANLQEFMADTDPLQANEFRLPAPGLISLDGADGGELFPTLSFYHNPIKAEVVTVVERSSSLAPSSWTMVWDSREDPDMLSENLTDVPPLPGWITVRDKAPVAGAAFLRLRYSLDP